ncbi:Pantothenate kinase [Dissostichus eleginoides]|uniref:Pantothenate kinase n=1 Tax=Dissostichus eleginoides TaxID=100907 RepID=A0AAD9C0X7_DISEL|nr:Pantothenate kinase [Dissostichus eleginoides]
MQLFSRLYIACQTREGKLHEFFRHKNQPCPPALSEGGGLRFGKKSDLLSCLKDVHSAYSDGPKVTCTIVDGAAIIQMLKPTSVKTFNEYTQEIFIPYLNRKLGHVTRLDLVWDRYLESCYKSKVWGRGAETCGRRCTHSQKLAKLSQS